MLSKEEITSLEAIFSLARVQLANSRPDHKNDLIQLLNFEVSILDKLSPKEDKVPDLKPLED
tara:strand:+ start:497 stop:682 length:186 start_codon:yes stop_codon:yes gene_type:complete